MSNLIDWMENTADQVPGASAVLDRAVYEFKELMAENQLLSGALEDIREKCQQSRTMTRRIRWIEQRAYGALTGEEYKENVYDMPKNGKVIEKNLREKVKKLEKTSRTLWDMLYDYHLRNECECEFQGCGDCMIDSLVSDILRENRL